ncbi:MAG TPA: hypothetical protein VK593_00135 [Edaphobacter sp.]|nr:hypothetical protein [Edaphobacter sp.]
MSFSRCAGRVKYVVAQAKDALGLSALLICPDGFVVWAAEGEPDVRLAKEVATRWFDRLIRTGSDPSVVSCV